MHLEVSTVKKDVLGKLEKYTELNENNRQIWPWNTE